MLRKVCLLLPFVFSACTTEDPGIDKTQFPSAMAAAACSWAFTCCDAAEVKTLTTGGTEAACTAELTTTYNNLYANANPAAWSPKDARQVVLDVQAAAASCPRGFNPASTLNGHQPVFPSKGPGNLCNNTFSAARTSATRAPARTRCPQARPAAPPIPARRRTAASTASARRCRWTAPRAPTPSSATRAPAAGASASPTPRPTGVTRSSSVKK